MKICVVTGSRADFGLLKLTARKLKHDPKFELKLVALGHHFLNGTYNEIIKEGFEIAESILFQNHEDSEMGVAGEIAVSVTGCAQAFLKLKPDLVLLLGDRHEIFGAAQGALICRIPVGHIHGGEITNHMLDDTFRHAITKISSLHFVSTEECRQRVIQMGEMPERVFTVGGLGVDAISNSKLLEREELIKDLDVRFNQNNFLITFHSVTLENGTAQHQIREIISALEELDNTSFFFTASNSDQGGRIINNEIKNFVAKNSNSYFFESLGQLKYFSLMKQVNGVIGNSSSGILEAPYLGVPTVNIGERQTGRSKEKSVIHCAPSKKEILPAILSLCNMSMRATSNNLLNLYGTAGASERILSHLRQIEPPISPIKEFFEFKIPSKNFHRVIVS